MRIGCNTYRHNCVYITFRNMSGSSFVDPFGYLWFCHFPIRCPGTAVVLDCIDSFLPSSLLSSASLLILNTIKGAFAASRC